MVKRPTKQTVMRKRWDNKNKNNNLSSLSSSITLAPPVYKSHSHVTEHHGCSRNDDFYWLCDRSNRKVKQLLKAENKYMEHFFTLADNSTPSPSTSSLRRKVFRELASRIRSNDISLPSRERSYWYYSRYVEHEEHPLLCRRPYCELHAVNTNFAHEVSVLWESNPNALLPFYDDEEIYLDLNLLKEQLHLDHIDIGEIDISHNEQQLVLTVDWSSGKEVFAVLVMNIGHVDYASWLKQHAHPLHRAWAEKQHRAGQSIYGSPTRRSPLFASASNASWQSKNVDNNNNNNDCCYNCSSLTCNDTVATCGDIGAGKQCTEPGSTTTQHINKVYHKVEIEMNQLNNSATSSSTTSNSRRLPLHDIVCVIDDIAIGDEVMWADETHVLYFALDDKMRPYQLIYHTLISHEEQQQEQQQQNCRSNCGKKETPVETSINNNANTPCANCTVDEVDLFDNKKCDHSDISDEIVEDVQYEDDIVCYEEDNEAFWLGDLTRTADEKFCMFTTSSSEQSECFVCPTITLVQEKAHINRISTFVENCQVYSCHKCREHLVEWQPNKPQLSHAPIVRTAAMSDCTMNNAKELISQSEHLIGATHNERSDKECNLEQSLLHCMDNNVEYFKELWNKSGEMICFAPRHGSECQPIEYEIDHHDCLLAECTHTSNSGAWVIVSNAHGCTNHAVFILPDDEVRPSWQQCTTTTKSDNINIEKADKTENSSTCKMCDIINKTYSLTCPTQWRWLFTYDEAIKIEHVELFRDFLLISVRKQGNPAVLFCPVSLIHNWWHLQKETGKSTADKITDPIPINHLCNLQDIIKSTSLRTSSSSTLYNNVQQSIAYKLPNVPIAEICELANVIKNGKMQHEKQYSNKSYDKIKSTCDDDSLTLALESVKISLEDEHHNHNEYCESRQQEQLVKNEEDNSSSPSSSPQVTPRLSSLPYNVEAMGFTGSFHSCEFRILVTHMLEPLTYYHALYCKHNLSVSEGSSNDSEISFVNTTGNNCVKKCGEGEDDGRDGVLIVTRMCQEVVVSAPGESAYNVQNYDGAVMWVPSNYAFEENNNNNIIGKVDNNTILKPLPTLEPAKVVEIPVFLCWKRLTNAEGKQKMELEHIEEQHKSHATERTVQLYDHSMKERYVPIRDVLLRVYGSYGDCTDPCFNAERLTLLHRGFIVASAALRGGGEFGIDWRDAGRKLQRATTVNDLISVGQLINDYQNYKSEEEHLEEHEKEEKKCQDACNVLHEWRDLELNVHEVENVEHQVEIKSNWNINKRKAHLIISGDSAGGFVVLRAAVAAPSLFHAVIAAVPFVDCLTTLLDDSLPLTVTEWEEFGNPLQNKAAYDNIAMLSPYEAVDDMMSMVNAAAEQECSSTNTESHFDGTSNNEKTRLTLPHIFMLTDWNDSRVGYWESLKLTAKLRSRFTAYRQLFTTQDVVNASLPSCTRRILIHYCELDECDVNNNNNNNNNNNKNNCNGSGGHCGPTGRYEDLHELAREYAFALIVCGKC